MATNQVRFVENVNGASKPFRMMAKFQAGSTQAIKQGEILEFTGDTNSAFVPLDSDCDMSSGLLAIAHEEIKAGDREGYYEVILPRPGDIFVFELASASAVEIGAALYYSSSEKVTTSAGSNVIGYAAGQRHYPHKQGHTSDDASPDMGTTIKSTTDVEMMFVFENSYLSRMLKYTAS